MRVLKFECDALSKTRFEIIFHGLFILGNQNTNKGLSVLRTELSILDKIEEISKPCECGKKIAGSEESDRELVFVDADANWSVRQITLSDQEFDLLYDYISKVPWSIGKSSRDALKTLDWIKSPSDSPAS